MATAAGVTLSPAADQPLQGRITTTDSNLSVVTVPPGVRKVTVQISGADARLQARGAVQGAAPASTAGYAFAGQAWDITPGMCGGAAQGVAKLVHGLGGFAQHLGLHGVGGVALQGIQQRVHAAAPYPGRLFQAQPVGDWGSVLVRRWVGVRGLHGRVTPVI